MSNAKQSPWCGKLVSLSPDGPDDTDRYSLGETVYFYPFDQGRQAIDAPVDVGETGRAGGLEIIQDLIVTVSQATHPVRYCWFKDASNRRFVAVIDPDGTCRLFKDPWFDEYPQRKE